MIHLAALAGLLVLSIAGAKVVTQPVQQVTLVAPQISDYMPISPKAHDTVGGGGGGGDHDKLEAPKGKLPRFSRCSRSRLRRW